MSDETFISSAPGVMDAYQRKADEINASFGVGYPPAEDEPAGEAERYEDGTVRIASDPETLAILDPKPSNDTSPSVSMNQTILRSRVDGQPLIVAPYPGVREAVMYTAAFERVDLADQRLNGLSLENKDFVDADLSKTSFENSSMRYSEFSGGEYSETDFRNADLSGSLFKGCDLRSASFRDADLSQCIFENCKMPPDEAFRGANLQGMKVE